MSSPARSRQNAALGCAIALAALLTGLAVWMVVALGRVEASPDADTLVVIIAETILLMTAAMFGTEAVLAWVAAACVTRRRVLLRPLLSVMITLHVLAALLGLPLNAAWWWWLAVLPAVPIAVATLVLDRHQVDPIGAT
ncbi:hypothetical protein [Pseudonocardia sp. TRM90224]|uniref:hypothetical protein n=1 Tax=Pseudonocardia sp. TRM90224 TaxID=2812678 RepID=UPI001E346B71|nr:hypothetical protein [Pseudonocardia sp. TRM90224]